MRQTLNRVIANEKGSTLALVAVTMTAMLGVAALAVDLGMVMTARTETQRVADLAALAGAGVLIQQPGNASLARQTAIDFAAQNNVQGLAAAVQNQDVDVDLANGLVRVRMYRTASRGTPVPTFFARVLGISTVDVGAVAAAQVYDAQSANCLLPVALSDRWINYGGPGWDPAEGDTYIPKSQSSYSGYTDADIGSQIVLKPSQGASAGNGSGAGSTSISGGFEPGWWYLWIPDGSGASQVRPYVLNCPDESVHTSIGDWVTDKNGNMQAIERDFEDLIAMDPYAQYNSVCECITGGAGMSSPRLRWVPIFDPTTYSFTGSNSNFQVAGFAAVFIESVGSGPPGQRNVYARIMSFTGAHPTGPAGGTGSLAKTLRLVE